MPISLLLYLLILVVVAFTGGVICKLLKQPPLVGYLLSGLVLGSFFGTTLHTETINFLAELGVVLLLFTVGVEFSFIKVKQITQTVIYGALVQVILSVVIFMPLLLFFNLSPFEALFVAVAFSQSSTAVVVKLLSDRGELATIPGELMVGWGIFQDISALPLMILLPAIGKPLTNSSISIDFIDIFGKTALAVGILAFSLVLGRLVIPWFMEKIAALNSRELLVIGTFVIAVGGAYGAELLGLSPALGAFLAGLLISQSMQNHAVFSEMRPLRDIFAMLFFTTLGLVLPPGFFFSHLLSIVFLTLLVVVIKFLLVFGITVYFKHHTKTAFQTGLGLANVGEFAFILGTIGVTDHIIQGDTFAYIVSVALLTILFFPPLLLSTGKLYKTIHDLFRKHLTFLHFNLPQMIVIEDKELPLNNHVVLCGYGRVGKYIGRALAMSAIQYVVIEYNQHKARELKVFGVPVVYGDPADIEILKYAHVDRARAIVIAIPDLHTQKEVITHSLTLNKDIAIYCRTHHEDEQKMLKALGVSVVIQPEFEASLSITTKILKSFGQKSEDIEGKISRLKIEHGLG